MLITRNWLQSYFETELPSAEHIADTLMLHAFEIEGLEKKGDDAIIDIDVLPNRAHDCLSHDGVAREYAALTGQTIISDRYHYHHNVDHTSEVVNVIIENPEQCYRYLARKISNIEVQDSPDWLQDRMKSIGQRSINNIVDATNYVMFDLGNPMHAFDADKVVGDITVRNAKEGEEMITLSGEELVLTSTDLVIADNEGILALAGVKGGRKAEVDNTTKNIILEVANFNPLTTRQTARRVKIQTDSSKRFENAISSERAPLAMENISRLISDCGHTQKISIGAVTDVYPKTEKAVVVDLNLKHVQNLLGIDINTEKVSEIFERLNYQYHEKKGVFSVHVPSSRLDLRIAEDLIEEIGRIYGYHNIQAKNLEEFSFRPKVNNNIYLEQKLRNFLIEKGYHDVMTYTFVKKGDVSLFNPIASDKSGLRKNLHKQIAESLKLNVRNADYFGLDTIALFEIGHAYKKDEEVISCSIAVQNVNKAATKRYGTERVQLDGIMAGISELFGQEIPVEHHGNSVNFDLTSVSISQPDSYGDIFSSSSYDEHARFHSISSYQFTTRDISFWAPEGKHENELKDQIFSAETDYLKKVFLFDQFEKNGRTSFAFSMVFQSETKTLTDGEVDSEMNEIEHALKALGCEIR